MNGKIVWRRELIVNFEKFGNSLNCSFFILLHPTSNITIYIYMCINFYNAYSSLGAIG